MDGVVVGQDGRLHWIGMTMNDDVEQSLLGFIEEGTFCARTHQ